jgi:hypothetical protein
MQSKHKLEPTTAAAFNQQYFKAITLQSRDRFSSLSRHLTKANILSVRPNVSRWHFAISTQCLRKRMRLLTASPTDPAGRDPGPARFRRRSRLFWPPARTHALHRPRKNCRVPDHSFLHPTRCLFHPPPLQPGFSYQRCRRRLLCRRVAKQTCYSCRICITCLTFSCVSSSIGAYLFENGDDTNKGKAN